MRLRTSTRHSNRFCSHSFHATVIWGKSHCGNYLIFGGNKIRYSVTSGLKLQTFENGFVVPKPRLPGGVGDGVSVGVCARTEDTPGPNNRPTKKRLTKLRFSILPRYPMKLSVVNGRCTEKFDQCIQDNAAGDHNVEGDVYPIHRQLHNGISQCQDLR